MFTRAICDVFFNMMAVVLLMALSILALVKVRTGEGFQTQRGVLAIQLIDQQDSLHALNASLRCSLIDTEGNEAFVLEPSSRDMIPAAGLKVRSVSAAGGGLLLRVSHETETELTLKVWLADVPESQMTHWQRLLARQVQVKARAKWLSTGEEYDVGLVRDKQFVGKVDLGPIR